MRISSALLLPALGCTVAAGAATRDELLPRSFIDDLEHELEADLLGAVDCAGCEAALGVLKILADFGDSAFSDVLADLCTLSKAEDADVCQGIMAREGPIIAQAVQGLDIGSDSSHLFCTTFLGVCSIPDVRPFPVQLSPKPASTGRPAPSGQTPLKIVHYSDIHVDPFYVAGSNYNCTKPICCRPYTSSDAPGSTSFPAGPNGEHSCDAPPSLEDSMYAAIHAIAPDAAFALFTGDIVDHAIWNTTDEQNILDINDAYNRMASSGLPLVYGTAGNHESNPTNAYETTAQGTQAQWVYDALKTNWEKWVGTSNDDSVATLGAYNAAYTSPAGGKLRVINLNTNLYYIDNFYLYEEPMEQDPSGQWTWLVQQLDAAEKAGDRAYIIGHMPPGVSDAFHEGSNYFDQIINRYQDTIAAMFWGHTHADHFQISYTNYSGQSYLTASAINYIVPSLTPTSGMPAFRIYTVDPLTFAVLDAVTYTADMTDPGYQTTGPVWKEYYSAKTAYGSLLSPPVTDANAELSPAFWHNVTALFAGNQDAFNAYLARKSRGWAVPACTGDCVTNEICQLRAGRAQDNCGVLTPGLHFSKRDDVSSAGVVEHLGLAPEEKRLVGEDGAFHKHRDECGVPVMRETLAALTRGDVLGLLKRRVEVVQRRGLPLSPSNRATTKGKAAGSPTTTSAAVVAATSTAAASADGAKAVTSGSTLVLKEINGVPGNECLTFRYNGEIVDAACVNTSADRQLTPTTQANTPALRVQRTFSAGFRADLVAPVEACVGFNGTHLKAKNCAAAGKVEIQLVTLTANGELKATGGACANGRDGLAQMTADVTGKSCARCTSTDVTAASS